ncbi:MAG: aldehyde dehydrogenase family protein [Sandaracinaceae bacterium]|nr:aldehyde dehydrogenase family protein [Sandaracinaceae bacterium]MBK7772544.1 aldehyde dehydrogenase family protein [Sandaracinaceae bacterium]MBK8406755.1 aldehyde dehydrogenase family protein [Sandaracinaceae bacterium]MBP7682863.1 aldehyde dehydrogenase family protein [Deltaproteobacteria bacterium]
MTGEAPASFHVTSAFDEVRIETLAHTSEAAAHAALEVAHGLHEGRAGWLSVPVRVAVLKRFAALVGEQAEALARQAAREGGKPLADSRVEIARAINGVEVAIAEIPQLHGTEVPMGQTASSAQRIAHTFREPRGVVLAISAFNHPFNLIIHQVITAIAAGCPVLVKPATATPLSCRSVVQLLAQAGLPAGWCQLLLTTPAVTEALVADPRVSFLTFIGSAKVGWQLRSKLAPGAACALEHGGVAPVIVDPTADLDDAIPLLVRGGFYHAGQVCVSVQRIYVHQSVVADFTQRFVAAAQALRTGDPLDETTEVGPLISRAEVTRVDTWVQEAIAAGARLLCGGHALGPTTYAPTVLLSPPDDARVSCEEVFGPVVAIYPYAHLDEAIARANAPDVFFQASIFTRDLDTALSASRRLAGMAVLVNDHSAFRVDWMPFGGHRQSGLGLGGIGHTMRDMSLERMVVFRSRSL